MESVLNWRNPLRVLPTISPHPAHMSSGESPLPPPPSPPTPGSELWHDLRQKSTQALENYSPSRLGDDTREVLGVFLKHLSGHGQANLMTEVVHYSTHDPTKLRQLRDFLVNAILKPLKLAGLKGGPIVDHVADPGQDIAAIQASSPLWAQMLLALKDACLDRDGHRCVLTGLSDVPKELVVCEGVSCAPTQCTHIIPCALSAATSRINAANKPTIWWALYRYFPSIRGKIGAKNINSPANALTLTFEASVLFGRYDVELMPDGLTDYTYSPQTFGRHSFRGSLLPNIKFEVNDPNARMPEPELIRFHGQVGRILHESGIGSKIQAAWTELDDGGEIRGTTLAPDGSTDVGRLLRQKMLLDI